MTQTGPQEARHELGIWNAHVIRGETRDERSARLEAVPEDLREQVRRHVVLYFRLQHLAHRLRHGDGTEPMERGRGVEPACADP